VLNSDGTARRQKVVTNGVASFDPVTQNIPIYQLVFPGGDTQVVTNFEYRIPIFGPVILAAFADTGINKLSRTDQLLMNPDRVRDLNTQFPQAGFDGRVKIAPGTQAMRMSTGLELQVMMPVVNAPFRLYYAYNPLIVNRDLQPPIVADRSFFPNEATFIQSVALFGRASPFHEKRKSFRFTIGRTF
jgi:outer membrane protein insertion porin family